MLIRVATAADAGEVHTLCRAAFLSEGQRYGTPHLPALTETLAAVREAVADPAVHVLVAVDGHRIIGTVRMVEDGRIAHLLRLAVAPDRQGEGIGTLLTAAAEGTVDVVEIRLFTGVDSGPNIRLYERLGYVRDRVDAAEGLVHLAKRVQPRIADTTL